LLHFFRQHHYPLSMPILGSIVVAPTRILSYFTMSFGSHSGLLIASRTHPQAENRATKNIRRLNRQKTAVLIFDELEYNLY